MAQARRSPESSPAGIGVSSLIAANHQVLRQGLEMLAAIDDQTYVRTIEPLFAYGVGSHIRHCLDSYNCFLNGAGRGMVDFDNRSRDGQTAIDRGCAMRRIESVIGSLGELPRTASLALLSKQDSPVWAVSSIERELQFLLSHTVHHFALIALILRVQGVEVDENFGVAPSTLDYWNSTTRKG